MVGKVHLSVALTACVIFASLAQGITSEDDSGYGLSRLVRLMSTRISKLRSYNHKAETQVIDPEDEGENYQNENTPYPEHEWDEWGPIEDWYTFPGSNFTEELIRQTFHVTRVVKPGDVREFNGIGSEQLNGVVQQFGQLSTRVQDPTDAAVLFTRMVIRAIMAERWRCPSSVYDFFVSKVIMAQLDRLMSPHENWMYNETLDAFEMLLGDRATALELMRSCMTALHDGIYKDVLDMMFGYNFEDLARASHEMYPAILKRIKTGDTTPEDWTNLISKAVQRVHVGCIPMQEIPSIHRNGVDWFFHRFQEIDIPKLHSDIVEFLRRHETPEFDWSVIPTLVHLATMYIEDAINGVAYYEIFLSNPSAGIAETIFKDVLDTQEFEVLHQLLRQIRTNPKGYMMTP